MPAAKLVAKRPTGGPAKLWEFPRISRQRLGSGLEVITANSPGRALCAATLLLEAGATNDPQGQAGVAYVAARALTEGTDHYKGSSFAQAIERLGADISANVNWDTFAIDLTSPLDRMEPALELLAEAARSPAFGGREVDRARDERTSIIMQEYASPAARAAIAHNRLVYTPASAYHRSAHGEFWSVQQLGKGKVRKYYQQFATPGSATLIVVGDLEGMPVEKIVEKSFGSWKGKEPSRPAPVVQDGVARTTVLIVDREDAEQSQLAIGHVGLPRTTPDFFAVEALNAVLGGTINSRLMQRLREESGFTYGVSSSFQYRRQAGPFRVTAGVQTKVTADAIAQTIEVMETVRSKGITKAELEEIKGFLIGVLPLRFETPAAIASGIAELVIYGLAEDFFQTYRAKVEALTLEDIERATEHIHTDRLAIVVVGDAEKIHTPLLRAELGPVAVIEDPEFGKPPIH